MQSKFLVFRVLLFAGCAAFAPAQVLQHPEPTGTLAVTGEVSTPLLLKAEDLAKMPRQSASVEDEDGTLVQYEGVLLRDILKRAGVAFGREVRGKARMRCVVAQARDGYQVVFTLAEVDPEFANETILVVDTRNGKPVFPYQGPFRLLCPNDKAGARSIRMVETLQVIQVGK
jgi:DMSO/TMAO reductase YedYZ molybdopterin-dependent catalytic subunit